MFDNVKKLISSNKKAVITDQDNNKIYLEKFEYLIDKNIFKSVGYIKVQDKLKIFTNLVKFILIQKKKFWWTLRFF